METVFATLGLIVCIGLAVRMSLKPERQRQIDTALRQKMQRFMDIARACRPQFFGRRRASRLAHEAILRAKARAASAHKTNANAKNN